MIVSKEDILHIANLAQLSLEEDEIEQYQENLQDILNFAEIINSANTEKTDITISANEAKNRFRKDEVKVFEDNVGLMQNAIDKEQNMFKLPKVLN